MVSTGFFPRNVRGRLVTLGVIVTLVLLYAGQAAAQSRQLAPGFTALQKTARVVLMPTDIELFSISAGGVVEPRADWTEKASTYFKQAMREQKSKLGLTGLELTDADGDELSEVNFLHAALASAISVHHFGALKLPTKNDKLDWSMGDAVAEIKKKTGADYALFSWVRDSYASGERVAAMFALALFGIGIPGGIQVGYASLVDLNTGQILWFNQLARGSGDLREPAKAAETVEALLSKFPVTR